MRKLLSLPKLRIPTIAQLRDGSFLRKQEVVEAEANFSYIKEFEARLVQAQELALWSSPVRSMLCLVISQAMVYHLTRSPLLPILAKLCLSAFLYSTWVYRLWPAIRVPPEHPEDSESWTPLHPDVLSAPELASWAQATRLKVSQVASGQKLLRAEQPGKFCLLSSTFCLLLAIIGMQFSTAFLLHLSVLLALTLPALLVRAQNVPSLAPGILLIGDFLSGLGDFLVYRGLNAPPLENKDLDEFVPEVTHETATFLDKALSYVQRRENEEDISLTSGLSIPSHEEVECGSLNNDDLEADLIPVSNTLALEHGAALESDEDSIELAPRGLAMARIGDFSDSEDDDSLDLQPLQPVMCLVTSSVTSVTATVSSVSNTVSSVTSALLGSLVSKTDSEPDLEEFELVNESDLDFDSVQ